MSRFLFTDFIVLFDESIRVCFWVVLVLSLKVEESLDLVFDVNSHVREDLVLDHEWNLATLDKVNCIQECLSDLDGEAFPGEDVLDLECERTSLLSPELLPEKIEGHIEEVVSEKFVGCHQLTAPPQHRLARTTKQLQGQVVQP